VIKAKLVKVRNKFKILFSERNKILSDIYTYDKNKNICNADPLCIYQCIERNIELAPNIKQAYENHMHHVNLSHNPDKEDLGMIVSQLPNLDLSIEQIEALHFFNVVDGDCIIGDDMGVGKSLSCLAYAELKKLKKVLIVAPASVKSNWLGEINKFNIPGIVTVCEGDSIVRQGQLLNSEQFESRFVVINYEMLDQEKYKILFDRVWDLICFDESHYMKNRDSKRTKEAKKLKATKKIYMSGTALTNDAGDIWSILNMIDPKRFTSYWTFAKYFANVTETDFGTTVKGHKQANAKYFRFLLSKHMLRRKKEIEAKQIYINHYVKFTNTQKKLYKQAKNDYLYGDNTIGTPVERFIRLNQISVDPMILGLDCGSPVNEKVLELAEPLDKVIIGCSFKEHSKLLEKLFKQTNKIVYRIDGDTKNAVRDQWILDFKNNNNPCVFIATIRSMAEGKSIDECDNMIIADYSYHQDKNKQFECRIYRPQTTTRDKFYQRVYPEQIGKLKREALQLKQNMLDELLDGKEPSRSIGDVQKYVEKELLKDIKYDLVQSGYYNPNY
jgi:SWI/SNF-related matrix-associated actin-dependent regulator of chromatin subfamily A-like protein 1